MRKFTISVSVLLLLVISAVLFGPGLVNWNKYKSELTDQVRAMTGRELEIAGDLSLRLLPSPSFSANNIRFENTPNSAQSTMISIEELGVKIAILPLLSGRLRVDEVVLRKPVVMLERFADGTVNWELVPDKKSREGDRGAQEQRGSSSEEAEGKSETFLSEISLGRFQIIDGTINYSDLANGFSENFNGINAEISAKSLSGPISLAGDLLLRGQRTEIELALGQFAEQGATAINVGIRLPDSQARLKFNGSLSKHVNSISYRGKILGDGKDLGSLVSELFRTNITTKANSDFELSATLEGDLSKLTVEEIMFRVGAQKLTGDINVNLQDDPIVILDLASPKVNLDDILTAVQKPIEDGVTSQKSDSNTNDKSVSKTLPSVRSATTTSWPTLPKKLSVTTQLSVENVIYNRQLIRDFVFQSNLTNGIFEIEKLNALFPSGGQISLVGNYSNQTVNGQVSARTEDLRGVLSWLKVNVPQVPNDRLRRLDGKVRFTLTPNQMVLNPISVTLDVTHLEGAATIVLRDRVGIGARLVVDRIDLDAYKLNSEPISSKNTPVVDGPEVNAAEIVGQDGTAQSANSNGGVKKSFNFLNDVDANLDISLEEAIYRGVPFKGLKFDGTLQQGILSVRNASLDDVVGSSLALSGTFSNLSETAKFDATIIASVDDLPKLLIATGDAQKDSIPDLGPLKVSGNLKGTLQDLAIDLLGSGLGGGYQAQGHLLPTGDNLYEGLVKVEHPSAAKLLRKLNPEAAVNNKWGRVTVKAMVKTDLKQVELSELDGTIAGTRFQGSILAALDQGKPQITANLITGVLNLKNLLPDNPQGGASGGASGGGSLSSAGLNRRWSHKPIDLSALSSVDADVTLISDEIIQGKLKINNVQVKAVLKNAVLKLSQFTGTTYGGPVSVKGVINGQRQLVLDLDIMAENIDTSTLFRDIADFKRVSGPISISGKLMTNGGSEAELVQALRGTGTLQGVLKAKVKKEEAVGGALLGVLGTQVRGIKGVGDTTITLLQAFSGQAANLKGTYSIQNGVLVSNDLRLDGNRASVFTVVKIDLPAWLIDSQSDLFREGDDPTKPYLTVLLTGNLDKPNPRIKGQFLQSKGNPLLQLLEGGAAVGESEPQADGDASDQVDPVKKSTKQKAKDILKGLFKGLGG